MGGWDSVVPAPLWVSIWDHVRATWLGAGHVDLVGGDRDPTGQQLLQLHPQDVAVLLWGGGHEGQSPPSRRRAPRRGRQRHLEQDMAALVAGGEDDGAVLSGMQPVEADGAVGHVKEGAKLVWRGHRGHREVTHPGWAHPIGTPPPWNALVLGESQGNPAPQGDPGSPPTHPGP